MLSFMLSVRPKHWSSASMEKLVSTNRAPGFNSANRWRKIVAMSSIPRFRNCAFTRSRPSCRPVGASGIVRGTSVSQYASGGGEGDVHGITGDALAVKGCRWPGQRRCRSRPSLGQAPTVWGVFETLEHAGPIVRLLVFVHKFDGGRRLRFANQLANAVHEWRRRRVPASAQPRSKTRNGCGASFLRACKRSWTTLRPNRTSKDVEAAFGGVRYKPFFP